MDQSLWPLLNPRFARSFGTFESRGVKEKDGKLWIEGTASASSTDRHKTRWKQDSIRAALPTFTTRGLHYMHDLGAQIGKIDEIEVTDTATRVVAWVGKDFQFPYRTSPFAAAVMLNVNDVRAQMEQGLMSGLSIDALCDEEDDPENRDHKLLTVTDLIEFSVCAIPSNRDTLATVMRNMAAGGKCPLCSSGFRPEPRDASVLEALAAMQRGNDRSDDEMLLIAIAKEIRHG